MGLKNLYENKQFSPPQLLSNLDRLKYANQGSVVICFASGSKLKIEE
jgi:hypothetical protein